METPEFSIIIAVKNAEKTVKECLESLSTQTFRGFEVLVADGASTDGTLEILKAHSNVITWLDSRQDSGVYAAWNRALTQAKGRWVLFLGADDVLNSPTTLMESATCAAQVPDGCGVFYGMIARVTASGALMQYEGRNWPETQKALQVEMAFAHQGVFHRRDRFAIVGAFDETYKIAGDYEWFLRELKNREAIFFPDLLVTRMRNGGISSRPETTPRYLREVVQIRKAHGISGFPFELVMRFVRAYLRLFLHRVIGSSATLFIADIYRVVRGKTPIRKLR